MSNNTSFIEKKNGPDDKEDSESSYDSTNAFNVRQHTLKNQNDLNRSNPETLRSNIAGQIGNNKQKHSTWKEHQKFLSKIKMAKVFEARIRDVASQRAQNGDLGDFDFPVENMLEDADGGDEAERQKLDQVQLKINGLHIRFEEDYFSADKPYSIGLIAEQLNLNSTPQGQETWHFPDFLKTVFDTRPMQSSSNKPFDLLFKNIQAQNCRIYVNSSSEIYIPIQMYEECKNLPMQIFETLQLRYLMELMAKRNTLTFLIDPVDLIANLGDVGKTRFYLNLICGKIRLNLSEPVLRTFFTFKMYIENVNIIQKLKQYRPQRKPMTNRALGRLYHGKDVQELPESVRRKRKLLVRDWFYYAIWYVRLRNVEWKRPNAWDRLCKAQLAHDPDRYRDLVRAASKGMQPMKEWLQKEEHVKRLEQKERANLLDDFSNKEYEEVSLTFRIEQLNLQLYENVLQVGIGLPLYDINVESIAYEKHLESRHNKLGSRLAAGHFTLKQVHAMENDHQFYPSRPMSRQTASAVPQQSHTSVLSNLLRSNDRKMNKLNRTNVSIGSQNVVTTSMISQQSLVTQTQVTEQTQPGDGPSWPAASVSTQELQKRVVTQKNRQQFNTPAQQTKKTTGGILSKFAQQIQQDHYDTSVSQKVTPTSLVNMPNRPQSSLSMNAPHNSQGYLVLQAQTNIDNNSNKNTPQSMIEKAANQTRNHGLVAGRSSQQVGGTNRNKLQKLTTNSGEVSQYYGTVRPSAPQNLFGGRGQKFPKKSQLSTINQVESPHIIHQTDNNIRASRQGMPQRGSISMKNDFADITSPIRQEEPLPRGSRFLTLLDLKPTRTATSHIRDGGGPGIGIANCGIDILYEVPRFNNLDEMAPQSILPSGLVSLQRHFKVGILTANEFHTEQLLEGLTKLFCNYTWCINFIVEQPSLLEPIFSVELQHEPNREMYWYIIRNYLGSAKPEREAQVKKIKLKTIKSRRSFQSNESQVYDGVTSFRTSQEQTHRNHPAISVPKIGVQNNPLRVEKETVSGEENLTDDAIKEMDDELGRINSAERGSPVGYNQEQFSHRELRQKEADRERINFANDSPLLKAIFEIVPRIPVDYKLTFSVHEARIAVYSSFVPIMRMNLSAPFTMTMSKESQVSMMQVGSLQTFFMSEPEMLFAFARTLNANMYGIFNTPMLRTEKSLQKMRDLIKDSLKAENKMKKVVVGTSYNMLFKNLADDAPSETNHQAQSYHNLPKANSSEILHPNNMVTLSNINMQNYGRNSNTKNQASTYNGQEQDQLPPYQHQLRNPSLTNTAKMSPLRHSQNISREKRQQEAFNNATRWSNKFSANTGRNERLQQPQNAYTDQQQETQNKTDRSSLNNILRTIHSQTSREPLNDPSQNRRGAFQQHQNTQMEESKQRPPQFGKQENQSQYKKVITRTKSSDGTFEEDLDEKYSTSQLFGYDSNNLPKHGHNQYRKPAEKVNMISVFQSQESSHIRDDTQDLPTQNENIAADQAIQPPKVSQLRNKSSMGQHQLATEATVGSSILPSSNNLSLNSTGLIQQQRTHQGERPSPPNVDENINVEIRRDAQPHRSSRDNIGAANPPNSFN